MNLFPAYLRAWIRMSSSTPLATLRRAAAERHSRSDFEESLSERRNGHLLFAKTRPSGERGNRRERPGCQKAIGIHDPRIGVFYSQS